MLTLGRYYLGVPLYRLEGYQAMVEVPVSDATQWDQIEALADCTYPVFEHPRRWRPKGEVIYQDDTPVRVLSLIKENRHAEAQANDPSQPCGRTGMYTTGLVVQHGDRTICLYIAGRAHAGEFGGAVGAARSGARQAPGDVRCPVQS